MKEDTKDTNLHGTKRGMSMRHAGLWGMGVVAGALALLAAALLFSTVGCSLLGAQAKAPTRFEESLYTTTNVPMVTKAWTTNVVQLTNTVFVPQVVTQTNTVTVTNAVGVVVPQYVTVTNTIQVAEQQVTQQTNAIAPGSTVLVPQLTGRTGTGDAIVSAGGAGAGVFGYGAIAVAVLSGIGHWWQNARNNALVASYTGATATANTMQQVSTGLTQEVETLLEVLNTSPQGQALVPTIKQFLMNHQVETGTITTIAKLVEDNVDNEAARDAAAEILKAAKVFQPASASTQTGPVKV